MTRAQAINDQVWSDEKKITILGQFLAGMASDWFDELTDRNPGVDYHECCKELVNEFKPTLTDPEISKRIQDEHKRPSKTYREFASRLTGMANAMEGGMDELANGRIVLDTFLKNAWPRYTDLLRTKISMRTTVPTSQLSKAVYELTELAGSDGKMRENKRRHQNDGKRPAKKPAREEDEVAHTASAVTIERKQKPHSRPKTDYSKVERWTCHQLGYTAAWHHMKMAEQHEERPTINQHDQAHSVTRAHRE
jgi:hypothetical protein